MKFMLTFLTVLLIPLFSFAGEEDLYAPVPPADSAFVRTVNMSGDDKTVIRVDGSAFPAGDHALVSNYAVIKQGEHALSVSDKKQSITIEAKQYYTIFIFKDSTAKVMKDGLIEDPSKAMLYFYNLSDSADGVLSVPSHKATVFEKIAAGDSASRVINAVSVDLAVKAGTEDVATLEKVELKRQSGTSVFLTGEAGKYTAFSVQNKVAQ